MPVKCILSFLILLLSATVLKAPFNSPDEKGNFDFSFYTNDLSGKFTIVVEGLTDRGGISARKEFTVNP